MSVRTAGVPSLKLRQNVEWIECETIRLALEMSTAKAQAAKLMGISPRALSYYLDKHQGVDKSRVRCNPTHSSDSFTISIQSNSLSS